MPLRGSGIGDLNYSGDPVDWWVVTAGELGDLKFTLDVPAGQDFELQIYNSSAPNGFLGGSYKGTGQDEEVIVTMTYSGPYYAKVYTFGSSIGSYTITNQVIPPNHSPSLTNGYVTPTSGGPLTTFTYYVTYKDQDGDAPSLKTVQIDGSGGSYQHDMTYVSGSYTSGAVYKYTTTLSIGNHSFYCYFTDEHGAIAQTNVINSPSVTNRPPDISISSPSNNSTVSGTVTVSVTAYDPEDGAVSRVEYYIDNILKYTDYSPKAQSPASQWNWNTTSYSDASHNIKVVAWDSSLNSDTDNINVTVQNNHSPSLANGYVTPTSGGPLTNFTYYVTYTDADGDAPALKTVQIDGSGGSYQHDMTYVSGNYTTGAIYKYETRLSVASHSFYFYFTDEHGAIAQTNVINGPSVTNQLPVISIDLPHNNDTVSGTVTISITAYDPEDGPVSKVEYYIDNVLQYTDYFPKAQTPASTWSWLTYFYLNCSTHSITVKGYDSSGASTSATITVTVDNRDYINISHIPEPPVVGETVTFSGVLGSGASSNRTIYISSTDASVSATAVTNSTGRFTYQWIPSATGTYYFCFGFAPGVCTFGDSYDVVTVYPARSKILSVSFSPISGSSVTKGANFNLRTTVGLEASSSGVLQVWVTGNGYSKYIWQYVPYSQSSIRQFDFTITAPSKSGTFGYNIYTQFRPKVSLGPLISSDFFDTIAVDEFIINIAQDTSISTIMDIPQGVSTFALPFDLTNKSISSVFGTTPPRYIYTWDKVTSSYLIYPKVTGYNTFSALELGRPYIIYSDTARQLSLTGKPASTVTINLQSGWNFIANSTGIDNLPIIAVTIINGNGTNYSLKESVSAGIIKDGIYELKGNAWNLSKFLKIGKGYYIYASSSVVLTMNPIPGPYLTSLGKDSFGGYVPSKGAMRFNIGAINGTTQLKASITGSDAAGVNLSLYDPSGALYTTQTGTSTYKEVLVNTPTVGNWQLVLNSTTGNDATVSGNVFLQHPQVSQYAALSTYKADREMAGWLKCTYGFLGHSDEVGGAAGFACDIGPNTIGLIPLPHTVVADEVVDIVQIAGTCVAGPVITFLVSGNTGSIDDYWNRCWPNLIGLVPLAGDAIQVSTKTALKAVKKIGNVADSIIDILSKKAIKVVLKQGETIDTLPSYLKALHSSKRMKDLKGVIKTTDDEWIKWGENENTIKGAVAEKMVKAFDEKYTTARGIMKASDIPSGGTSIDVLRNKLKLQKTVDGRTIGLGSYDADTWKASAIVKTESGAILNVEVDEVFFADGKLYLKEIKNTGANEWNEFLGDGSIDKLKGLKNTFDTEFKSSNVEVVVQSLGENPPLAVEQALAQAGIRLIKTE